MKFSGRLQVEADARNWLKADLTVAKGRVELTAGDDTLGTWAASQVSAERVEGDRFALLLGEERAMFVADDALGFSYEALPQLNKRQLIPVGGVMDKIKSGLRPEETQTSGTESLAETTTDRSVSPAAVTGKRLREMIKEAAAQTRVGPPTVLEEPVETKSAARGDWSEPDQIPAGKRTSALEGVFKRRNVGREHGPDRPVEETSGLPGDDLLEHLFQPGSEAADTEGLKVDDLLWSESGEPDVSSPSPDAASSDAPELADNGFAEISSQIVSVAVTPEESRPQESNEEESGPGSGYWDDPVADTNLGGEDEPAWESPFTPDDAAWVPQEDPFSSPAGEVSNKRAELVIPVEPLEPDDLVRALERIAAEARTGSLSPAHVDAITALVEAVASAVRSRD